MLKGKKLLITGGTGSFGNAVLQRCLSEGLSEIRIFSRDEKKQADMRRRCHNETIQYYLGDVRDPNSLRQAMYGVDYVFHAAALKQVPSCEFFPLEAVKTNVLGTENVLTAAIDCGVQKVICLSTDKAVYPVNAMGASKALMEKVCVAKARTIPATQTLICATRYGNVLCSRGSVIPLFIEQIKAGKPLTITDPNMTRFMMSLQEAVDLVLFAFQHAQQGDILVQKAPACTIGILAQAVQDLFGVTGQPQIIGARHGEKRYETLLTKGECAAAIDLGKFYRIPMDSRKLDYNHYQMEPQQTRPNLPESFNSNNTVQLTKAQVITYLQSLPFIQNALAGN